MTVRLMFMTWLLVTVATADPNKPLAAQPDKANAAPASQPAPIRDALDLMSRRLPAVDFQDVALRDAFDWLQTNTGAVVYVRWGILEADGIDPDKPVRLEARARSVEQMLYLLMRIAEEDTDGVKLGYKAHGDLLEISTRRDLDSDLVTLIYPAADLAQTVPYFDPATAQGRRGSNRITRTRNTAREHRSSTGEVITLPDSPQADSAGVSDDEKLQEVVDLVTQVIEPDTWEVNGRGGQGTIFPITDRKILVVRNSLRVHQALGGVKPR